MAFLGPRLRGGNISGVRYNEDTNNDLPQSKNGQF